MNRRSEITCFSLGILLFVLFAALPAFANYNLYVTVNAGGTPSYVSALNIDCGSGNGGTKCSDLNVSASQDLFAMAVPGVDANGNYDTDISWTGCPEVSQIYTCQIGRGPVFPSGNMYIAATFTKVYGLPSNIGVTVSGTGQGTVTAVDTAQNWVINCNKSGGTCSATINSGKSSYTTLYATPDAVSHFVNWTGCPSPNGATCQIPAGQNVNATATFAINTYAVTPSTGANGSISPNTPQTVNYNGTTSFTVTPNTGFGVASVTGCGGTLSGNTYSTGPITGNCTVTSTFAPLYNVSATAGANGSISPINTSVIAGGSATLTISPASSYTLASLTDNGVAVTAKPGTSGNYTYLLSNLSGNHSIVAAFGSQFIISSSVGGQGGGTISPASTTANYGSIVNITMTSQSGYKLTKLTDNGLDVSDSVQWLGGTNYQYPLNVTANHTIQAVFGVGTPSAVQAVPALSPTVILLTTIGLGGILLLRRKKLVR